MTMFKFLLPLLGLSLAVLLSAFSTDPAPAEKTDRVVKFIAPSDDCVQVYVRWRNGGEVATFTIQDGQTFTLRLNSWGDYQFRARHCSRNWCPDGIYTSVPSYTDKIYIQGYEYCY